MLKVRLDMVVIVLGIASQGCTENVLPICDAAALANALASARGNDTVVFGECQISGAFYVPAGVTLSGSDQETSILSSDGEPLVVRLEAGESAARLENLTVISDGGAAVVALGDGGVEVEGVTVKASRGIGMGFGGLSSVKLSSVELLGPVTEENIADLSLWPTSEGTALYGLILVRVGEASLSEVRASGFATAGAFFIESETEWQGGGVFSNVTTGLRVEAGSTKLRGIELCRTISNKISSSCNGLFQVDAQVETSDVTVCEGGTGLFHNGGRVTHTDLVVTENMYGGLWVQHSPSVEISGTATRFSGNTIAGLLLLENENTVVRGGRIESTEASRIIEMDGSTKIGDGLQIIQPAGPVRLENLMLSGNERVGLLLNLSADARDDLVIENVTVEGSGEALGAIAQGVDMTEGWDQGVERSGDTLENDRNFSGTLPIMRASEIVESSSAENVLEHLESL